MVRLCGTEGVDWRRREDAQTDAHTGLTSGSFPSDEAHAFGPDGTATSGGRKSGVARIQLPCDGHKPDVASLLRLGRP